MEWSVGLDETLDDIAGGRLKVLQKARGYRFSLDALLAYVSRAMIYGRWERMQEPYDINKFLYGGG